MSKITTEQDYRTYMQEIDRSSSRKTGITLKDMFQAISEQSEVQQKVKEVLSQSQPITIVVEGSSATTENVDVLQSIKKVRNNQQDRIIIIDISYFKFAPC